MATPINNFQAPQPFAPAQSSASTPPGETALVLNINSPLISHANGASNGALGSNAGANNGQATDLFQRKTNVPYTPNPSANSAQQLQDAYANALTVRNDAEQARTSFLNLASQLENQALNKSAQPAPALPQPAEANNPFAQSAQALQPASPAPPATFQAPAPPVPQPDPTQQFQQQLQSMQQQQQPQQSQQPAYGPMAQQQMLMQQQPQMDPMQQQQMLQQQMMQQQAQQQPQMDPMQQQQMLQQQMMQQQAQQQPQMDPMQQQQMLQQQMMQQQAQQQPQMDPMQQQQMLQQQMMQQQAQQQPQMDPMQQQQMLQQQMMQQQAQQQPQMDPSQQQQMLQQQMMQQQAQQQPQMDPSQQQQQAFAGGSVADLNTMIAQPRTPDEKLMALNEIAVRQLGDRQTYELLKQEVANPMQGVPPEAATAIRQAALIALGSLNGSPVNAKLPGDQLYGMTAIQQILNNKNENPLVKASAVASLGYMNRPQDKAIQSLLKLASKDSNPDVKNAVAQVQAGQMIGPAQAGTPQQ